jgi:hypothetical protein
MRKSLKLLAILFALTTLAACSLPVPNQEVCVNLAGNGGFCTFTLDERERLVPPTEWEAELLKPGRVSMTPEAFAEYQAFLQKACELAKCSDSQKKEQKKALTKMTEIIEAGK